jgi:hypothetical protein
MGRRKHHPARISLKRRNHTLRHVGPIISHQEGADSQHQHHHSAALGRPPKNATSPPPALSPTNTVISLPGSTDSSRNGMIADKKPPTGFDAPNAIMIDDDDMDDDY